MTEEEILKENNNKIQIFFNFVIKNIMLKSIKHPLFCHIVKLKNKYSEIGTNHLLNSKAL